MAYLCDGTRLLEVVDEAAVRNFGLAGGHLRYAVVRDCRTDEVFTLSGRALAACSIVGARRAA
jgi:hypothetical protein